MNQPEEESVSYTAGLKAAESDFPDLVDLLSRAETNRAARFKALSRNSKQLRGLEEILTYIKECEKFFRSDEQVSKLAFLLRRARGDFATAIESFLAGFHKTVVDSMRDVMEIEFLFRDFALHHSHIDEWLKGSERVRRHKFRPVSLRQRYAASQRQSPPDMPEATDYRGHSMLVHVLPYENPIVWATPSEPGDVIGLLVCVYDIFEHARRLFVEVDRLCGTFGLQSPDARHFLQSEPTVWEECQELWDRVAPILGGPKGNMSCGTDA